MMLRTLLALACVGTSLGLLINNKDDSAFTRKKFIKKERFGSSILFKVKELVEKIQYLIENDGKIDAKLANLLSDNELNSAIREEFNNLQLPEFNKAQDAQNARLTELEERAKKFLELSVEIGIIADSIDELQKQVKENNDTKYEIQEELKRLINNAAIQDTSLDKIEKDLDRQMRQTRMLERRAIDVMENLKKLRELIRNIINIQNSENAQTVEVTLTRDGTVAKKGLTADFSAREPSLQWGIVALHISERAQSKIFQHGYGPDSKISLKVDPSIYFNTEVDYDAATNSIAARLFDLSTNGFSVDKIVLQVSAFFVDNSIIKHEPVSHEK